MKRFFVVGLCVVCAVAIAQSTAKWGKDERLVKQWFYSDQGNVTVFMDWAASNLSQAQIDSLERVMFPDLPDTQKADALEIVKMQMEGFSLERLDDPNVKAALESLNAAIVEAKKTKVETETVIDAGTIKNK